MDELASFAAEIKRGIAQTNTALVSFDIFDTLVLRPALSSDDVIRLIALAIQSKYGIDLAENRLTAQADLGNPYATIDEIWDHVAKKNQRDHNDAKAFAEMEQETELQLLQCRSLGRELYDFAVKAGKRIIAVSDMHLSSRALKELLSRMGYDHVEAVYVSCEQRACKRDGSLFAAVLEAEMLHDPSGCVHIGDSRKGDFLAPRALGIRAFCLQKNRELFQSCLPELVSVMEKGTLLERLVFGFAVNAYIERARFMDRADQKLNYAVLLTFPVLLYSTLFLLQTPEIQHSGDYSSIFFLSRDGWLFYRAYELLRKDWLEGVLKGVYLYGSRIACRCLAESGPEDMVDARWIPEGCTLSNLIDGTVLDEEVRECAHQKIPQAILALSVTDNKEECRTALREFAWILQQEHNARVCAARQYYEEAFGSAKRVLLMDCGFCGTIAAYLNRGFEGHLRVDKAFLWQNDKNRLLDDVFSTTTYTVFDQKKGHGLGPLVEAIYSKLCGSCLGFEKTIDGNVRPVFEAVIPDDEMAKNHGCLQNMSLELIQAFGDSFAPFLRILTVQRPNAIMEAVQVLTEQNTGSPSILDSIRFPETLQGKNGQLSVGEILRCRARPSKPDIQ